MKTMKKVFALALALIMVLGLSVAAFAEDETAYTITVTNTPSTTNVSIAGKTFNAYKIFGVTYADTDSQHDGYDAYAYTISKKNGEADNPWFNAVITYMAGESAMPDENGVYTGKGLTLTPTKNDPTVYVVETTTDEDGNSEFDERAFADFLTKWLNNQTETLTADGTGKGAAVTPATDPATEQAVISDLPAAGYYLVTGEGTANDNQTVVAAAALYTTDPTAEIDLKAEAPTLNKDIVEGDTTADGASADVGDTVTFQLTSVVPDMTGYASYTYVVTDTLSEGLTPKADNSENYIDVTVTIDGAAYTNFAVAQAKDNDGNVIAGKFTITFNDFINQADKAGKAIVITYSATVNENALTTDAETNTATLEYSNDPYTETKTTSTPETTVYVYDFDIIVDKYAANKDDEEDTSAKLAGAEFVLVKITDGKETFYQAVYAYTYTDSSNNTVTVYSKDGTNYYTNIGCTEPATVEGITLSDGVVADVNWVEDSTDATHVTTKADGAAKFQGLEEGTYYLRETKAPDGYNQLTADEPVTITVTYKDDGSINTTNTTKTDNGQYSITSEVANSTGTRLPSTGGIGTTIFYVVGSILVIGAAVLLITKKRMSGSAE